MRHSHNWWAAAPIDPNGDRRNKVARAAHRYAKTETFVCRCGAQKMELTTNGHVNRYITRADGGLWRGRTSIHKRSN